MSRLDTLKLIEEGERAKSDLEACAAANKALHADLSTAQAEADALRKRAEAAEAQLATPLPDCHPEANCAVCEDKGLCPKIVHRIEGCQHTLRRMMEWAQQSACPICLTAALGMATERAEKAEAEVARLQENLIKAFGVDGTLSQVQADRDALRAIVEACAPIFRKQAAPPGKPFSPEWKAFTRKDCERFSAEFTAAEKAIAEYDRRTVKATRTGGTTP